MTKKELVNKLDELGGRIEDLRSELKRAYNIFDDALLELDHINDFYVDLPSDAKEIEDDVEQEQ